MKRLFLRLLVRLSLRIGLIRLKFKFFRYKLRSKTKRKKTIKPIVKKQPTSAYFSED